MLIEVAYTPITASASPPPSGPLGGTCPQANLAAYSRNGGAKAGAAPCSDGWPCAFAFPATTAPSSNEQNSIINILRTDTRILPFSAGFANPPLPCQLFGRHSPDSGAIGRDYASYQGAAATNLIATDPLTAKMMKALGFWQRAAPSPISASADAALLP